MKIKTSLDCFLIFYFACMMFDIKNIVVILFPCYEFSSILAIQFLILELLFGLGSLICKISVVGLCFFIMQFLHGSGVF